MIRFFAKSRCAHCVTDDKLTKGSVGIPVYFYLEDWDNAPNRVVVFKAGNTKVDVALLTDNCTVPPEVLANPGDMLVIGVYGTDGDGNIVIPTVYAEAGRVRLGTAPSGISPTPTTQPLIDQLVAAAEEAERIAQSVRDDADSGAFDGATGPAGADGKDGNCTWFTEVQLVKAGELYYCQQWELSGRGNKVQKWDPVYGPAPGESGTPTYLYRVTNVSGSFVIMQPFGSLVGADGAPGVGVPPGGTSGQVLKKNSSTDYDTEWADESGSVQSVNSKTGTVVLKVADLDSAFKDAILQIASKVAYIDTGGATYYQALYDALNPPAEVVSISAVFTQGAAVIYPTTSLDDLKQYLVVTATYEDSTTETLSSSAYTLSGTLTAGTSTITVSYGGKSTTFQVTVTAAPQVYLVTNELTGCTTSNSAASLVEGSAYAARITASTGYTLVGAVVTITMGGQDITASAYSGGVISIPAITGALVISVAAAAIVLSSITAAYTQGNRTVFSNDSLDSLKPYLVVTASYSDGTTETVSADGYTLYGTLAGGVSTITVSYGGKTDTFDVTVTDTSLPSGYTRYDYIKEKTNVSTPRALSNFIFLNDQQDMNSLSIEIYLARKAVTDGAGFLGARVDAYLNSVSFYCAADGDDLLRFVIRGVVTRTHIDLAQDRATKVEIINPETSPAYWRVDGGELHEVVWESSPVVPYGFALFNNFPHSATSNFNINRSAIIGDIILRKADGECVGYYIPCVYSGKIGMYDIISETFYTAATAAAVTISNSGCLYAVGNW